MASSKEFLNFILEQLDGIEDLTYKSMMGEYLLYYRGRIVGGIYDDRFLVRNVKAAREMMPHAELALPYDGAKEMLAVDNVENPDFLATLLAAMYDELPAPKRHNREKV